MALAELQGALVFDHDSLPIRFILQTDGIHVYSDGKPEMFLAAADVLGLAHVAGEFYGKLLTTDGTVPEPQPVTG